MKTLTEDFVPQSVRVELFDGTEKFLEFGSYVEMAEWSKSAKAQEKLNGFVIKLIKRAGQQVSSIGFQVFEPAKLGGGLLASYEVA